MKDKKHIDELFQEGFNQFEASPSPKVWKNIQAELKKEKEDRKIIPLWWKLGGVAALLALLLTVGKFVFFPADSVLENTVVVDDTKDSDTIQEETVDANIKDSETSITEETTQEGSNESSENPSKDPGVQNQDAVQNVMTNKTKAEETVVAVEQVPQTDAEKKKSLQNPLIKEDMAVGVAKTEDAVVENKKAVTEKQAAKTKQVTTEGVEGVVSAVEANKKTTEEVETIITDPIRKDAEKEIQKEIGITEGVAISKDTSEKKTVEEEVEDPIKESDKPSIFDAIEENKEAVAAQQKTSGIGAWEVTPNFGPVYYSSLGNGSSLDPAFADNSQTGDVNFSYGVAVSYVITDKISVRSGVNNVNVGYTTGGVELGTGPVSSALRSVDYGDQPVVLSAFDQGTLSDVALPGAENNPFANVIPKTTGGNAEITQNITYYEVPMELKYALLNKRFGINMIGGFSTLFLGSNEISVRDGDFRSTLGEANNLNKLSFSTNLGLGFDYKFSKRFKFNIEPMFKYQLNPYTDSSVSFRPYYLGVYSGLSFRF